MSGIRFTWDPAKARQNLKKHGVSFDEAVSAFSDDDGLLIDDPDHSDDECRFVLMGRSSRLRILVVCHCYRDDDDVVRIISARRAVAREAAQYEQRRPS